MPQIEFHPVNAIPNDTLRYAVIAAQSGGQWIFCRHQERTTWELPGGHREPGEFIINCARRELQEETGAAEYELFPQCTYSVTQDGRRDYGMLFYAEVKAAGPLRHEIAQTQLFGAPPQALTYPLIQSALFKKVQNGPRRSAGVIFDMDGLMLDSERIYHETWKKVGRLRGVDIKEEMLLKATGLGYPVERELFKSYLGADFDFDAAFAQRDALVEQTFLKDGIPLKPHVFELLDTLAAHGIKKAVATSTRGEKAQRWLKHLKLYERFDEHVFGDMVPRGKPEPDIFLLAAQKLALPPARCMVLEDSINGIRAAHAAGALPVMVPDLIQPGEDTLPLLFAKLTTLADAERFCLV